MDSYINPNMKIINISKSVCTNSLKPALINIQDSTFQPNSNDIKIKLNETQYRLKEGEYINEGIKIVKHLFDTSMSKFYLGHIEEIKTDITIKNIQQQIQNETVDIIDKLSDEIQILQTLIHPNIISYYNVDVTLNDENSSININILMDYFKGISLYQYFMNYNKKSRTMRGLPLNKVKVITKGILSGLDYLYENDIVHSELNPMNILVNEEDPSEVKIINYSLRIKKEDIQKNPYYSSPELSFHKMIHRDTDIWSVGSIVFELFTGRKPYADLTPFNAMCKLAQYISPIEAANDSIKDIIYDKPNRSFLDFLLKCFRTNENTRPEAKELLKHKFLS